MGYQGNGSIASTSSSRNNNLNVTRQEKERIELFHIRVVSKHNKINTLFDTGSQENLISEDTVKKLKLETIPHPKTYPIGCVVALMHTCKRELSPAHLVCPRRHNV